jgi:hypothetical protein
VPYQLVRREQLVAWAKSESVDTAELTAGALNTEVSNAA